MDPNSDARIASFGHTTGRPDPPAGPPARESVCDLGSDALQPASRTSADAAALPIFPDQVRYDEVVEQGAVLHALRFIVNHPRHGYVYPARHYASSDTSAERTADGNARVKAGLDIPGYPPGVWVIPQALKTYGMFVADNGSDSNLRWDDTELDALRRVRGAASRWCGWRPGRRRSARPVLGIGIGRARGRR